MGNTPAWGKNREGEGRDGVRTNNEKRRKHEHGNCMPAEEKKEMKKLKPNHSLAGKQRRRGKREMERVRRQKKPQILACLMM